ncbi:hypothetical protein ACFY9C_35275 [Streptomyces filamentosus]
MTPGEISVIIGSISATLSAASILLSIRRGGKAKRKSRQGRHRKR